MARFNIYKVTGKSGNAIWLEKGLSTSNANDYVMFNRRKLKRGERLIIEDGDGNVDMEFTKDSVITPRRSNFVKKTGKGYVYMMKMESQPRKRTRYQGPKRKPKQYDRMWRMKSKQLYSWLRNPKNGTKKDRRMASYILSTRKRR